MSESTALSTVVNPSPFAKQSSKMGDLFVRNLQEIFNTSPAGASVTSFSSEQCSYSSNVTERVAIKLVDGRVIQCAITTPSGGA